MAADVLSVRGLVGLRQSQSALVGRQGRELLPAVMLFIGQTPESQPMPPFDWVEWTGARIQRRPQPAQQLWPAVDGGDNSDTYIVDCWRVILADADGNIIGQPRTVPMQRRQAANRTIGTRDL